MRKKNPELMIVAGAVAVGKTRFRREKFSKGYVILDAGEIFIKLSNGEYYDFPSHLEAEMDKSGQDIASNAVSQRLNIVTEMLLGDSATDMIAVIDAMQHAGYDVKTELLTCSLKTALKRNRERGPDNISAYYTQEYHQKWLVAAAQHYTAGDKNN